MKHFIQYIFLLVIASSSISCAKEKDKWDGSQNDNKPNIDNDYESPEIFKTYTYEAENYNSNGKKAFLSDEYEVWLSVDGEEEQELQVLMSNPNFITNAGKNLMYKLNTKDGHYNAAVQRSFSFVSVSFNESKGASLKFRVKSKSGYTNPKLAPKSYNLLPNGSGSEFSFECNKANRYIAVNFDCVANHPSGSADEEKWIKDMLCIFIDPIEEGIKPPKEGDDGVLVVTPEVTSAQLEAATTKVIYFKPGHYSLFDTKWNKGSVINSQQGLLTVPPNKMVYISGGAFIDGAIHSNASGVKVQGRGIVSGRKYGWKQAKYDGISTGNLIRAGANAKFEGIFIMEAPNHGIVAGDNTDFDNVKMIGWHCNNDGFRPTFGSTIHNCFIRACDDALYNYDLTVENCVFWPMWNGSIMTFGWRQGIPIAGSEMTNCDIISPEWCALGNNCGLIMSQCVSKFKLKEGKGYTIFDDIRIEGEIPGFVNMKPCSDYRNAKPGDESDKGTDLTLTNIEKLGSIGEVKLRNITIDSQKKGSLNIIEGLKGELAVLGHPEAIWFVHDIFFENVVIGGVKLTDSNKDNYFKIEGNHVTSYSKGTTRNIVFEK